MKRKKLTKEIVEKELKKKMYPVMDRFIERETKEIINELKMGVINATSNNKSYRKTR